MFTCSLHLVSLFSHCCSKLVTVARAHTETKANLGAVFKTPRHRAQVLKELDTLSASYPFQVPSYFALILRAFSVIEGIALRVSTMWFVFICCRPAEMQ